MLHSSPATVMEDVFPAREKEKETWIQGFFPCKTWLGEMLRDNQDIQKAEIGET